MAILVTCACGRDLQLREELAGKLVSCPGCSAAVRVPTPQTDVMIIAHPPPPSRKAPTPVVELVQEYVAVPLPEPTPAAASPAATSHGSDDPSDLPEPESRSEEPWKAPRRTRRQKPIENYFTKPIGLMEGWGGLNAGLIGGLLSVLLGIVCLFGIPLLGVFFIFVGTVASVKGLMDLW